MSEIKAGLSMAGRYRLDVLIGEGGMATVWRGTDLSLSRDVAIKVLREEVTAYPDAVSRFRREAHAAAKLNHPNVAQIYDTGTDGSVHYIVMEYLPEPDLKKIIHDWAPLPESKVLDVAVQCCRALAYSHRNGIIHRDVKPHNILFTNDGRVKLSDFGIASAAGVSESEPGGFVLGSANYISPEQAQGSPAGPHSDLYSLGCVLYEALTGQTPFEGETGGEITAKHVRERPRPVRSLNSNISPSVEFIVSKAMAREVAQRYRSAEEMLADLTKLTGGEGLDRTGVLAAPEDATTILQPRPPVATEGTAPTAAATEGPPDHPDGGAQQTPSATPIAPVLRPGGEPRRTLWGPISALVIAGMAILVVAYLLKTSLGPGEAPKKIQVPMLKGEKMAEAQALLKGHELSVGKISFEEDPMQPAGVVIGQTPEEGQMVEAGSAVNLLVNRGTEMVVTVPVKGDTLQQANERLEEAGLSLGEVTPITHATVPKGIIIDQSIRPGVEVEKGTGVDVRVSMGPEPVVTVTPPEPDGGRTAANEVEPDVRVVWDQSYQSSNPAERRFIVTVTVQGTELGQSIQVVYQDDRGGRVPALTKKLNPNETHQVPIVAEGAVTIEVLHNGQQVYVHEAPAPELPGLGDPGPEAPAEE